MITISVGMITSEKGPTDMLAIILWKVSQYLDYRKRGKR